jgi:hypothetical protein
MGAFEDEVVVRTRQETLPAPPELGVRAATLHRALAGREGRGSRVGPAT